MPGNPLAATNDLDRLLAHARRLNATAQVAAAQEAYLDVLRRDAAHFEALTELGNLASETGRRSAARTAYEQAVRCHPDNPVGRINFGNALCDAGQFDAALIQFEAALATSPGLPEAYQGLGRIAAESGDYEQAERYWQQGFAQRAVVARPYRGAASPIPVLVLVSARPGNIAARQILDERIFAVTLLCAEFHNPAQPLPPHALILNAIGDADLCATALARAGQLVRGSAMPLINPPSRVLDTGRAANAARLADLDGVIAPRIRAVDRASLPEDARWHYPLLLRSPGFHTGRHFIRVERREELAAALASLPGKELLAIDYLDARGADGMARKYRVMFIDHVLYPLHLAISNDWKVHYFSASMHTSAAYRDEERCFLEDMPSVLGSRVLSTLAAIECRLGLDYAGVDFAVGRDGSVLLFEANATMVVYQPDDDPIWDYRRGPIGRVLDAARQMLFRRAGGGPGPA